VNKIWRVSSNTVPQWIPIRIAPGPPEGLATPAEVRRYFAVVLSQKYQVQDDEAEQLVKIWHYGTGGAVQSFDVDAYRGIFGRGIGTLLYLHHLPRPVD
jgi:hypothetical protein